MITVRRSCGELDHTEVLIIALMEGVAGGGALVHEVGVEDVELVALDDLRRRVVQVVVRLVVLVPLEPQLHTVEVVRFTGLVLVDPAVLLTNIYLDNAKFMLFNYMEIRSMVFYLMSIWPSNWASSSCNGYCD